MLQELELEAGCTHIQPLQLVAELALPNGLAQVGAKAAVATLAVPVERAQVAVVAQPEPDRMVVLEQALK